MPQQKQLPQHKQRKSRSQGEEIFGLIGGFAGGYFAGEAILARFVHPLHWVLALLGGALGYFCVLFWFRFRQRGSPRCGLKMGLHEIRPGLMGAAGLVPAAKPTRCNTTRIAP